MSFMVNKSANFQPINKELYRIIPYVRIHFQQMHKF